MTDKQLLTLFPTTESNWPNENVRTEGALLRDYFAAKAMQGDWANQNSEVGYFADCNGEQLVNCAKVYYRMADAMLKARG
ncbi:hypothetical protein [Providencia rettgeri]|uniref:hypothetical protein n=1 Tax=Providencia rettgeri TaxID=587 RepID=UPI002360837F|nr:hypothetical protein [Providencia rettgeri]